MNKLRKMIMKRKRRLLVCAPEFCGIELLSKPVPDVPSPRLGPSYPKTGSEEKREKEQPIEYQKAKKSKRVKLDRTADDGAQRLENEATVQPPPPSKPTDPVASTSPSPLEYVALCPQQWAARTALAMAQLTDTVRALLGHSHTTPDMVGVDLLGSPASHSTRAAESMGMGIPVGGGFLGSSNSNGESCCGLGFGWLGGVQGLDREGSMGNSSGLGGGFGCGFGGGSSSGGGCGRGTPRENSLFSPWQGCSIQGHAQGHACHMPLCSSSRLRMINGIAPVPHTPPPPLPPSSEPTPSLRRHEIVPPWASSSSTSAAPAPSPMESRLLTAGTLHPVLGAASNHAVGFLPEWRGAEAGVVAGMRSVRALQRQQQRGAAHGLGQRQPQQKQGLGKGVHKTQRKMKARTAAAGDASQGGGVCAQRLGGIGGGRSEEVEEEMRQRDAEDGQWWHNLRFTLCMLRRGLSKDKLARGALIMYIIAPSPEPYDVHRCCMEAAACLTPPPDAPEQPMYAPPDAATNLHATQPPSNAPANPSATQPPPDKPRNPSATQPAADAPTSLPDTHPQADASENPSAKQPASSEPTKGGPLAAGPGFHPASQPSPPQSVAPPPSPGTQTAAAPAAAAAAWGGSSFGVEIGSALGPSFHISDTSLPAAGMLVQVLLPYVLHDPTSSNISATALSICNCMQQGLQVKTGAHHVLN